jgi:hypothetical protein
MKIDFLFDVIVPISGIMVILWFFVWVMKENMKIEEEQSEKLRQEIARFEAEKLSKKMKDFNVEIAVKKPQAFKTKRKPQKKA